MTEEGAKELIETHIDQPFPTLSGCFPLPGSLALLLKI